MQGHRAIAQHLLEELYNSEFAQRFAGTASFIYGHGDGTHGDGLRATFAGTFSSGHTTITISDGVLDLPGVR